VSLLFFFFFFFFQAEDGIRDFHVTGVQTCALPIFGYPVYPNDSGDPVMDADPEDIDLLYGSPELGKDHFGVSGGLGINFWFAKRSEERRVGKECRSRWSAEH